ncbi:MAG: O-antigen ligase family protein [Candidatus Limnocylindrales bacterium]
MNDTTQLRAPLGLAPYQTGLSLGRMMALAVPGVRTWIRGAAAVSAFLATLAIVALNEHAPLDITPGLPARMLASSAPIVAAVVAAWAVSRPWPALLVVLLFTPWWDAAQVSWQVGPVQVVLQTVFVVALALGCLLQLLDAAAVASPDRAAGRAAGADEARLQRAATTAASHPIPATAAASVRSRISGLTSYQIGGLATIGLLGMATLSTLHSPHVVTSMTVLIHGIFEPIAMGILLVILARGRRRLALVLIVLGLSVALGGMFNVVQSLPAFGSLSVLQAKRLLFSRLTYFNVGLFGELLAMATPLLLGVIAARRHLGLNRRAIAVVLVCLAICGASLFLTFSKSAWLATTGGTLVFFLLLARTWRKRVGIALAAVVLSVAVVPWPAFVLQFSPSIDGTYRTTMVALVGESRFDSWNPSALSGRGSLVERLLATESAVHMAIDNPILGIGLDQFGIEYLEGYKSPQAHLDLDSAHTFWAEVAAELGFPALGLVVLIYAAAMLGLWRVYRAPPDESTRLLAVTLLGSLVAWLLVATAFAGDMYRPWRDMSSDFVMMAVLTAAAFVLARAVAAKRKARARAALAVEPAAG